MNDYVLITAAKNEELYIEDTICSVLSQILKPVKWVIVSDNSSDHTDDIIARYAEAYDYIIPVYRQGSIAHSFLSKVSAITEGYQFLEGIDYRYIGILDADVTVEPEYFSHIIRKFESNSMLGICGGHIYCKMDNNKYIGQPIYQFSVAGAVQMFRRDCYESAGGLQPMKYGGEDARIEIIARMQGWQVKTLFNLKVYHHKPIGSGVGHVLKNRFREGLMDCSLGYSFLFELVRNISHVVIKPYFVGSFVRTFGYLWGAATNEKKAYSKDVQLFLRAEQLDRMFAKLKKGFFIIKD